MNTDTFVEAANVFLNGDPSSEIWKGAQKTLVEARESSLGTEACLGVVEWCLGDSWDGKDMGHVLLLALQVRGRGGNDDQKCYPPNLYAFWLQTLRHRCVFGWGAMNGAEREGIRGCAEEILKEALVASTAASARELKGADIWARRVPVGARSAAAALWATLGVLCEGERWGVLEKMRAEDVVSELSGRCGVDVEDGEFWDDVLNGAVDALLRAHACIPEELSEWDVFVSRGHEWALESLSGAGRATPVQSPGLLERGSPFEGRVSLGGAGKRGNQSLARRRLDEAARCAREELFPWVWEMLVGGERRGLGFGGLQCLCSWAECTCVSEDRCVAVGLEELVGNGGGWVVKGAVGVLLDLEVEEELAFCGARVLVSGMENGVGEEVLREVLCLVGERLESVGGEMGNERAEAVGAVVETACRAGVACRVRNGDTVEVAMQVIILLLRRELEHGEEENGCLLTAATSISSLLAATSPDLFHSPSPSSISRLCREALQALLEAWIRLVAQSSPRDQREEILLAAGALCSRTPDLTSELCTETLNASDPNFVAASLHTIRHAIRTEDFGGVRLESLGDLGRELVGGVLGRFVEVGLGGGWDLAVDGALELVVGGAVDGVEEGCFGCWQVCVEGLLSLGERDEGIGKALGLLKGDVARWEHFETARETCLYAPIPSSSRVWRLRNPFALDMVFCGRRDDKDGSGMAEVAAVMVRAKMAASCLDKAGELGEEDAKRVCEVIRSSSQSSVGVLFATSAGCLCFALQNEMEALELLTHTYTFESVLESASAMEGAMFVLGHSRRLLRRLEIVPDFEAVAPYQSLPLATFTAAIAHSNHTHLHPNLVDFLTHIAKSSPPSIQEHALLALSHLTHPPSHLQADLVTPLLHSSPLSDRVFLALLPLLPPQTFLQALPLLLNPTLPHTLHALPTHIARVAPIQPLPQVFHAIAQAITLQHTPALTRAIANLIPAIQHQDTNAQNLAQSLHDLGHPEAARSLFDDIYNQPLAPNILMRSIHRARALLNT